MYITTRLIGFQRGGAQYLFLYLTEDYVQAQRRITEAIEPALTQFAADLAADGALVRPFAGHEGRVLHDVLERDWPQAVKEALRSDLPLMLVIDSDFDAFDPRRSPHLLIPLRGLISPHGDVDVWALRDILTWAVEKAAEGTVFDAASPWTQARHPDPWYKYLQPQVQIGPFGMSFDLARFLADRNS